MLIAAGTFLMIEKKDVTPSESKGKNWLYFALGSAVFASLTSILGKIGIIGFICLSGLATGGSWLCYYKALQDGPASVVVPIDKLGILITIAFSYFVFGEKLKHKSALGLGLTVVGTLLMIL